MVSAVSVVVAVPYSYVVATSAHSTDALTFVPSSLSWMVIQPQPQTTFAFIRLRQQRHNTIRSQQQQQQQRQQQQQQQIGLFQQQQSSSSRISKRRQQRQQQLLLRSSSVCRMNIMGVNNNDEYDSNNNNNNKSDRGRLDDDNDDDDSEFIMNDSSNTVLGGIEIDNDDIDNEDNDVILLDEMNFLRNELIHLESLEDLIQELEQYSILLDPDDSNDDIDNFDTDDDMDLFATVWDEQSLDELLLNESSNDDAYKDQSLMKPTSTNHSNSTNTTNSSNNNNNNNNTIQFYQNLEQVLLQGVVPVQAGVGSECLVGDFGFDPLQLSQFDLFRPTQEWLLSFFAPTTTATIGNEPSSSSSSSQRNRPRALILRDYREAEIRHGRLAMLAAMIWPLQEMVDQFVLSPEQFGPLLYGPVTLPYFPLLMTAIMLLLGYLDIYSQAIKDLDQIGDAFLPGDCFWDPLQILVGAPDRMERNMQERELFNGRAAMIAIGAYIVEEFFTHKALIDIGSNALLLQPAYEIPFIQQWLDEQFTLSIPAEIDPTLFFSTTPNDNGSMLLDALDTFVQTTTTTSTMILL